VLSSIVINSQWGDGVQMPVTLRNLVSAPPAGAPSQLSWNDYNTVGGRMKRQGRRLAARPHMTRRRKWNRQHFMQCAYDRFWVSV